jgi:hypothetical protein
MEEEAVPDDLTPQDAYALLPNLADAVLRLGVQLDIHRVDDARWADVVRQFYLVNTLSKDHFVAVAGEQGAGKTQLLSNLYPSAAAWLRGNLGRGEKIPVAVVERAGLTEPQGVVVSRRKPGVAGDGLTQRTYFGAGQQTEWLTITRGENSDVLMAELEVPPEFLELPGAGFLLLPGWERYTQPDDVPHWQETMRVALALSPAALIVTDERRLANQAQRTLLARLREGGAVRAVVAVSRCENADQATVDDRVHRAAEVFEVDTEAVVPVGGDSSNPAGWPVLLRTAVERVLPSATDSRRTAAALLRRFVRNDLTRLTNSGKQAVDRRALDSRAVDLMEDLLDTFDQQCDDLRSSLEYAVREHYDGRHRTAATRRLQDVLSETGGLAELGRMAGEILRARPGERHVRLARLVEEAWRGSGDGSVNRTYQNTVATVVDSHWEIVRTTLLENRTDGVRAAGQAIATTLPAVRDDDQGLPFDGDRYVQLARALPVMALYARVVAVDFAAVDGTIPQVSEKALSSRIGDLADERKKVLAGLGRFLGSDRFLSEDIDLIENAETLAKSVFGKTETARAGAAVVSGALASSVLLSTIGVGVVAAVLVKAGNEEMGKREARAYAHLAAYLEESKRGVYSNVDAVLRLARDVLRAGLVHELGLDDAVNVRFALRSAVRDVEDVRARILEALGRAERG